MPELPEVETTRRSIEPRIVGRCVESVTVHRRESVVGPNDPPGGFSRQRVRPRPTRLDRALLLGGATVAEVLRHGKQLGITSREGPAVGVHLGMTGQVLYRGPGERLPARDHVHVTWRFAGGGRMVFRDPRRFGGVTAHESIADLRSARFGRLGPDGLTVTAGQLSAALGRSARAIKAALLDQTAVAGVGNIYADESLHRARLSPLRPAQSLAPADFDRLASEVRTVLAEAVEARGSTLRDYTDSDGNPGAAQLAHRVYGRAGQGCMACGSRLSHAIVGQRMTVWCERCQG